MAEISTSPQQSESFKKVVNDLGLEFLVSTFRELLKYTDLVKVYEYYKKLHKEDLFAIPEVQMAAAKNKGIDIAIEALRIVQSALEPDKVEVVRREKGAVGTVRDCPFKNAPPELCVIWSHLFSEACCEFADPEYECLWTNHMTNGEPFCRYVFKKKSLVYKDPDSLGKVITKLPRVDLTDEQLAQMGNVLAGIVWVGPTTCFKDFHGSNKTIEILCANTKRIGKNFGSSLIEANMLPARDIALIGGIIHQFGEEYSMKGKIISLAPGVFAKEITKCPFKNSLPEICKQWEAFFNGMLERTNPELEFRYDRMMTAGDQTCKWVVKKR